jgi:hypothetical protein
VCQMEEHNDRKKDFTGIVKPDDERKAKNGA